MKNYKKRTLVIASVILLLSFYAVPAYANDNNPNEPSKKIFTRSDIEKIADSYVNNNLHKENPVFVDVDNDGIFDMLVFNKGVVEYYKNTGTLENPFFVLINDHYDKYEVPKVLKTGMPMPIFFADARGTGKLDMFAVKQLDFNRETQKYDYRVMYAENILGLDTGTLITIILVLVIVILVLAILGR